jgi:hypothetical protein
MRLNSAKLPVNVINLDNSVRSKNSNTNTSRIEQLDQ